MITERGTCHKCGRPVTSVDSAAWPVRGWEPERGSGGTNHVLLRERVPGYIAHLQCVKDEADLVKRGIHPDQLPIG